MDEKNAILRNGVPQKAERNSSIELLRIIAMTGIVFSHIRAHAELEYTAFSFNSMFVDSLKPWGAIGDNLFVLISGYFLINSVFSIKKACKLLFQVTFYSALLLLASFALNVTEFSPKLLLQSFLPFLSGGGYWFIVTYMLVYFLSPLLNKGIKAISKNQMLLIAIVFGFLYIAAPQIINRVLAVNDFGFNKFVWMLYVYYIGAYLRLYPVSEKYKKPCAIALCVLLIVLFAVQSIRNYEILEYGKESVVVSVLASRDLNGLLPVTISCLLFFVFLHFDLKYNKWINLIASTVFGIYLIHDHLQFREYIWVRLFRMPHYQDTKLFSLYCVLVVLIIMVICGSIDFLRQRFLEAPVFRNRKLNCVCDRLNRWLDET